MDFKTYYLSLSEQRKNEFAALSGYERSYIDTHMIRAYKVPSRVGLERIVNACDGQVSWQELLRHFYPKAELPKADQEQAA